MTSMYESYRPKSGDEQNFMDKHEVDIIDYPNASEYQFKQTKIPKAKRKADYDEEDDKDVYEAANVHTKRADKEPVIVRNVDPKTGQSKARVELRRAGEIKIGEETDLEEGIENLSNARLKFHALKDFPHGRYTKKEIKDEHERRKRSEPNYHAVKPDLYEKVKNPYAIGMAAAMKATGDAPPLKKSTIVKGHEIAKSIKAEAMDPVGREDSDINNDGKVDKADKYLHARRRAIGKALRKEDLDEAVTINHDRYVRSHGKKASGSGGWFFTHKSGAVNNLNDPKEVHFKQGKFSDAAKSAKAWAKEHGHHSVYVMEEVGQIDEAVKVGAMKLHDGSSVTVTREMADKLNNVFEQLNPTNRVKMEEKLHASKKDFTEILKFAESI